MCTTERCRELDIVYRKYRRGKEIQPEDLWAVRRLSESDLIRMYVKGGQLYATASFKDAE